MQAALLVLIALSCARAQKEDIDGLIASFFSLPTNSKEAEVKDIDNPEVNSIQPCECVPHRQCDKDDVFVSSDTACASSEEVCCKPRIRNLASTFPPLLRSRYRKCGTRYPKGITVRSTPTESNDANFGEFPWMAAVLRQHTLENTTYTLTICACGGSLIHPQVVLTAAHCVQDSDSNYKIRVGEWDARIRNELLPHQDRDVKTVIIHPDYQSENLISDVALLILDKPVEIRENVDIVCLPNQYMALEKSGCLAMGWGKKGLDSGSGYYPVLQKLEVPIVSKNTCQNRLSSTSLGRRFKLHHNHFCAGGQSKKFVCKGDEGSPLVCPIPGHPGRYVQAGIVSMRLGCGDDGIPAVYTSLGRFANWIEEELRKINLDLLAFNY